MHSRWTDDEAGKSTSLLGQRVYSSRLLGSDPSLVLHGGGNTSVKTPERDVFGDERDVLYVKGSGADLATIDAFGFTPLLLEPVTRLATLERLSDPDMVRELASQCIRPGAPAASIEAILHAIIPHRFVDHTHADAILAITDTADGAARVAEIYGDDVIVIPYVMPGFALARACAVALTRATPRTQGIILLHHGVFSFGDTAHESYERMIALVTRAEEYCTRRNAWSIDLPSAPPPQMPVARALATLRRDLSTAARRPMIVRMHDDERARAFARRADARQITQRGPATPDHIIRTKRVPMIGRDAAAFAAEYTRYFERNAANTGVDIQMLDPAPRVVVDEQFGLVTAGANAHDANAIGEIYLHTIDTILRAEALGGYEALPERDLFDVEYWDLEQAKLRRGGTPPPFAGEVAIVTGAASGIGRACAEALLADGAAVAGIDISSSIRTLHTRADYLGVIADVTDPAAIESAIELIVRRFGGVDIVVANAGIFPPAKPLAQLGVEEWRMVMNVNAGAVLTLLHAVHPLLVLAPRYGRIVIVGSRNVPAPGPGVAAYSASKAAVTQLARVAALEWGRDRIRVNVVHPHAVFDTGLWTPEIIAQRAAQYGMSEDEYRTRNVLGVEITSADVAALVVQLCGPAFSTITGAQIPIDGGNERVI